ALSAAVPVRGLAAGAAALRRGVHGLDLRQPDPLSRGDARDRRPAVRLDLGAGGADGAEQHAGRAERLSHRGADRRHAVSDAGAPDPGWHLPWSVELQATIRRAVPAGADRRLAVADLLQRRRDHGADVRGVVARLRHRELASLLPLAAGIFAVLPGRGQGALVETAKPVRADPILRRRGAAGVDAALDPDRNGSRRAGGDVAQPDQLFAEGRGAGDRRAAGHALSLYVRHDGADDPGGVPGPYRV